MASVWGIDIGKAALKAVKLASTKDGYEIQALDYFPYPVEEVVKSLKNHQLPDIYVKMFRTEKKLN